MSNVRRWLKEFVKSDAITSAKRKKFWAYMAQTGCVEKQFRDEFAFFLEDKLKGKSYVERDFGGIVSKKSKKMADIVIYQRKGWKREPWGCKPKAIIELKSAYSLSGGSIKAKWVKKLIDDCKRWRRRGCPVFALFILADIYGSDRCLNKFGKYSDKLSKNERVEFEKDCVGYEEKCFEKAEGAINEILQPKDKALKLKFPDKVRFHVFLHEHKA